MKRQKLVSLARRDRTETSQTLRYHRTQLVQTYVKTKNLYVSIDRFWHNYSNNTKIITG